MMEREGIIKYKGYNFTVNNIFIENKFLLENMTYFFKNLVLLDQLKEKMKRD